MGLYDNRLAELSKPRRSRRVAARRGPFAPLPAARPPISRPSFSRPPAARSVAPPPPFVGEASRRPSMDIQSLLFSRADGWTADKAKQWAKSHGYKHGKVHVTDQYVRIRQFDPKGLKVKRTITLGRGIRAVVAREEDMAKRRKSKSAAKKPARRRTRRTRETPVATEAKRPRRRRARRARETAVASPRRRRARRAAPRRRRARAAASGQMMEARRPRRRARRRVARAWHGDTAGHRKAAKKGAARRRRRAAPRRRRRARETGYTMEARRPRRRRARRRAREFAYEAPRRRPRRAKRRRSRAREQVMEARRPRRSRHRRRSYVHARGGSSRGMYVAEMAIAIATAGLGFVLADGLDRFLATYDPSSTAAKPTDKFTSDGAGTLANTLNVAATPNLYRIGAAIGMTVVPAVGSTFVDQPFVRSGLEGMAIGAGVNAFKLLWQNVVMPLLAPKDTSTTGLQKSFVARLYPAEIAAKIHLDAKQTAVSGGGAGALSGPPADAQTGVGAPDVGPFALSGSSQYADAAQALRQRAGLQGSSEYADAAQALRRQAGVQDEMYPSAHDALRRQAGVSQPPGYMPGPPPGPGPGPQAPHGESCGCIGDDNPFLGFVGDAEDEPLFQTNGKAAA